MMLKEICVRPSVELLVVVLVGHCLKVTFVSLLAVNLLTPNGHISVDLHGFRKL